jgi:peptide/nickel transport system substrate-binding protein
MTKGVPRSVTHLGLLFALLFLCASCGPAAPATRQQGGPSAVETRAPKDIVVIGSGNPPGLDNRFVITSNNANAILLGLYAGQLVVSDNTGARMARLAEDVPTLENGLWKVLPDNTMETRLTIRQGTKWHDGTLVTTKDLLFNDEVYQDKSLPQVTITARTYLDRMEAADERTLILYWRQPYIMADVFSPDMMPAHILESTFRGNDQAIVSHPWLTTGYVGTGPFKLKDFTPGSGMELTAFDDYVLGRPKLDNVTVKFIPDGGTMLANILSGSGDLATGTGPNVNQAQQLKAQNWDGQISTTLGNLHVHMFAQYIDPFNPVLTDKRFHKALIYALNRQELVDTINYGYGGVAEIPWPTSDPRYPEILSKVERYPYDPTQAAAMFQSVGFAKGADGYLRSTVTGQRLEPVEFRTTGEQPFQVQMLTAMSDYFKVAGLDINQVVIPQERTSDRVYRVTNPGLEELQYPYGPATLIGWIHSSKIPTAENRYTPGNYPRYANSQWDAMIDAYAVTIPIDDRYRVIGDIMTFLQDNLPEMSIIYGVQVQFAARRLAVPETNPVWTAEAWDLR